MPTSSPGDFLREAWAFDDPAAAEGTEEERLDRFRKVRDTLEERIVGWVGSHFPRAAGSG